MSVHKGQNKAVYAYPFEHYDYWRRKLPDMDRTYAQVTENRTLLGTEKPVRSCGSPTCSRSVSPWEKQLARHGKIRV
ncbi:MOSC domain-containing protein [Nostoc sphaeroides]|uniref:MOSC domain-containing protein n=1 Tax=Nostoc sphaeroides TaxID=446679 RepID=UPI0030B90398